MEGSHIIKRSRDESSEFTKSKRFREADLILDILDDDDEVDSGADDLSDVIRSLEQEITAQEVSGPSPLFDLGYLLEASDDELGLPPAVGSSPSTSDGGNVAEAVEEETETAGFDRIWGYEDDVTASPYEGLEFGVMTEFDDGVDFDDGLFDHSDGVFGTLDDDVFPWRTESLSVL